MAKLKVLIVDDNEDVRLLTSRWLSEKYVTDTAVSGTEALKKLKKSKYDIILLDVMMPGPKPQELIKKVTAIQPEILIIYLTAVEMFNLTPEQEKEGFEPVITEAVKGYLTKPVDKNRLNQKIEEVLEKEKLTKKVKKPTKKDLEKLKPKN